MTVVTIAGTEPFLDRVAHEWLKQDPAAGTDGPGLLLVPSRRAGRALMEAFLRVLDGKASLLPRIVAINDVDEEALASIGIDVSLPPAVEPQRRLAVLSMLILQTPIVSVGVDKTKGIDRAWPLAKALADLMDEAERSGVDLAKSLPDAVEERFSEHWQQTLKFLEIVTTIWPKWLEEEGLSNPVARQVARLKAQAAAWQHVPPHTPVWAVGFADGSAAVSDVLAAVATLPAGLVILPGVDLDLPQAMWDALPASHPQAGLREILTDLGLTRDDLTDWDGGRDRARERLMRGVMLPEQGITAWGRDLNPRDISGLSLLPAQDQQQEAQSIALILRNVVSVPGQTCALVTPDRSLAQRVGTELLRFGIYADDSAGEPLAQTPAAVFLRLIATAAEAQLSPVALLSVLKHPLASLGRTPGNCHASARRLERLLLRGPAPAPGIAGLKAALETYIQNQRDPDNGASADAPDEPEGPAAFIARIEAAFEPLLGLSGAVPLPELLEALIHTAEALAATETELTADPEEGLHPGGRLWMGDDGEALSRHMAALIQHTGILPPQRLAHLDSFLNTSMAGQMLTGLRAHRGGVELAHPRVTILGVLEARLLAFDVVVLGGLNETVWPPATDPGPWLSRPMRTRVGLPSPERQIGISAHDFVSTALAAGEVVFSSSARRDGAPGVPARWMVRMEAFLGGRGQKLPVHPALEWQKAMDQPLDGAETVAPPEPRPPVALRPRRLSITEIETWMQDPYAIYAKHVLKLKALKPLEEGAEHADFGMIVHEAMDRVLKDYPDRWPQNVAASLKRAFAEELAKANMRPALVSWWAPRLERIADWVAVQERTRREQEHAIARHMEVSASFRIEAARAPFELRGRADRIDVDEDGKATIFDYKTGSPPTGKAVEGGWSVQLVLEGALLAKGAFEGVPAAETKQLLYWHLTGGDDPGKESEVPSRKSSLDAAALIGEAMEKLRGLIDEYDQPDQPYRSQPWAGHVPRYTDYAQLARVDEWRAAYAEGDDFMSETRNRADVIAEADRTQLAASDPMASVFVSASAGSGKTKLLIDRLLRLMLPLEVEADDGSIVLAEGANPSRILCLTYTKAAAAEMANRLQSRLGEWVSLPDERLGRELEKLRVPNTDETRRAARALFLKVLDLPGGLRIETIHAFCQSLLRRFPLEASVDPHFTLMEDTDTTLALREAMEDELAKAPKIVAEVAGTIGIDRFFQRIRALNMEESRVRPLLDRWQMLPDAVLSAYRGALKAGQEAASDLEGLICKPRKEAELRAGLQAALGVVTAAAKPTVEQMLLWLGTQLEDRSAPVWSKCLLTDKGTVRQMNRIISKKAQDVVPEIVPLLEEEGQRLLDLTESIKRAVLLSLNRALLSLAAPMLSSFREGKAARGLVDYNDLIQETRNLLEDPGAAWVLYKLDGGIDHLLLDEVQDNSGLQWEIAGALTSEFFSGEGAWEQGPRPRTVFAVGDYKQSIYGFQGADPEQFHSWRAEFARRVQNAGLPWRDPDLNVSFRSVTPVLSFVDAVFSQPNAAHGLLEQGQETLLPHVSARPGQGGRVELWPLVPVLEGEDDDEGLTPWQAPKANTGQRSAPQRLAEALAGWIDQQIGRSPQPGQAPLKAGDVLILVPRRSSFLRSLIRALKSRNVPVATLVRVGLTQQVAVRDLMTLCAALLLPQDDLTLAAVLTSPLGGLSDDSLMALATKDGRAHALGPKGQPLWTVLRERHRERAEWQSAWVMLSALYARVDYATPYRLLAEALGPHGGRTRLLRRLGPEAAEPVDELLTAALRYEGLHPPSLQGFLHWLEASEITSKREAESETGAVRVMTVHGSKGLQARLVVMPDTLSRAPASGDFLWEEAAGLDLPIWVPKKDAGTDVTTALSARDAEKARAENNRLLYVALTRASDWLVICGASTKRQPEDTSWYRQCQAGFETLINARSEPLGLGWDGDRLLLEEERSVAPAPDATPQIVAPMLDLPVWLGRAPDWRADVAPMEDAMTRPLAPSRPDGAEFGEVPAARSPLELLAGRPKPVREQAMRRGTMIHRLLQLLPETLSEDRLALATRWLSRPALGLTENEVGRLTGQVMGVLYHPDLAPLFQAGSRSEQPISGISEGRVVLGQVDRLWIGNGEIWICDYKTNRTPPIRVERTPVAYVRQMAAYRAVLQQLHPDFAIHCSLVWTEGPSVMVLPDELLDRVLEGS